MTKEDKLKKIVADPVLWIRYFVQIVNKEGRKVPFDLTYHQKVLLKNFSKFNLVAKSRQLGVTSLALAYSLYLTHTEPDCVCMIMSYSLDTVDIVFKKLKALYDDLSPSVKIKDVANNRKELILENRSRIICCVCGSKDAARGATLRYVHLTEVSSMDDDKLKNQLVAIEAALRPDGQMVLESTSKGMNYWFELWMKAVNGESQYKPFFFSWVDDNRLFLIDYEESTEIYKNRHGRYLTVDDLDEEEIVLYHKMNGEKNPLSLKKLMWRRMRIANIGIEKFRQEFPSNAMESFIVSGNNVFDLQRIQDRLLNVNDTPKIKMPVKIPAIMKKWKKDCIIWKLPQKGMKYYSGVDTGEGISSDNSVIEIIDQDGYQVFEFASNKIKPYEFSELVRAVGIYYNKSLLVVEKMSAGHTVVDNLYDSNKRYLNLYKYKQYDAKGKLRKKPGFETSGKSRPIIINRFVEWFDKGQVCINSKNLLNEMKTFQMDDKGKVQATTGAKDDRVMAFCMAIEGLVNGVWYIW